HRAAVAALDPPAAECAGDAAAAGVDLADRRLAAFATQERMVGVALDGGVERSRHRRRRGEGVAAHRSRLRTKAVVAGREEKRPPSWVSRKRSCSSPPHFGTSIGTGNVSSPSARSWRKLTR